MRAGGPFIALLLLASAAAAQDKPVLVEVKNDLGFDRAPTLIRRDMVLTAARWTLRNDQGEDVPAHYDAKAKQLLFVAAVPKAGAQFMVVPGQTNTALMPLWIARSTTDRSPMALGKKRVRRSWLKSSNGRIKVDIPKTEKLRVPVEIRSLGSEYLLRLYPVGYAAGCIDDAKHADAVMRSIMAGRNSHPEIFRTYPGIPIRITVAEPSPFERVITVHCHDYARKNGGAVLDLFESVRFEIHLTWLSPVVRFRSIRKQKKRYYNHNGLKLNEFIIDKWPIEVVTDTDPKPKTLVKGRGVGLLDVKRAMRIGDQTGKTVVFQPDFAKLGIYNPVVATGAGRVTTVIAQSWREGWKPIEVPARTYEDTLTLVCDVGDAKSLAQWLAELGVAEK